MVHLEALRVKNRSGMGDDYPFSLPWCVTLTA